MKILNTAISAAIPTALSQKQKGLGLIEIMIALGLGVAVTVGLVQVFSNTSRINRMETAVSRMQETGRFALEELAASIRMAGYQGCADSNQGLPAILPDDLDSNKFKALPIRGYEVPTTTLLPLVTLASDDILKKDLQGVVRAQSDVISVSYASAAFSELSVPVSGTQNITARGNGAGLRKDHYGLISNCDVAHVFAVSGAAPTVAGSADYTIARSDGKAITPKYGDGAKVMRYINKTYFVADTGRTSPSGQDVYALYVQEFDKNREELLEGVESLQILYGYQMGGAGSSMRYVDASKMLSLNEWDRVVAVRIGILVQSLSQVNSDPDTNTYNLPGKSISHTGAHAHAGDKALRKPFITTVRLRNRAIL